MPCSFGQFVAAENIKLPICNTIRNSGITYSKKVYQVQRDRWISVIVPMLQQIAPDQSSLSVDMDER